LTDARTFIVCSVSLAAGDDLAAAQVERRELDHHLVPGEDLDVPHPQRARHLRQHLVAVVEGDAEGRVRQGLLHRPAGGDRLVFRHRHAHSWLNTYGPCSTIATECSKCADRLPSEVTAVQPSSFTCTSAPPAFSMGSMASTMPSRRRMPRSGCPKFGTW